MRIAAWAPFIDKEAEPQKGEVFVQLRRRVIGLCCLSVSPSWPPLWDPVDCSTPGFLSSTIIRSLLKLMSIESVMPSHHLSPLPLLPFAPRPCIRTHVTAPMHSPWSSRVCVHTNTEYYKQTSFQSEFSFSLCMDPVPWHSLNLIVGLQVIAAGVLAACENSVAFLWV